MYAEYGLSGLTALMLLYYFLEKVYYCLRWFCRKCCGCCPEKSEKTDEEKAKQKGKKKGKRGK